MTYLCPYDHRPCTRPRCAVCPIHTIFPTDPPIAVIGTLPWTYDPADFPGYTIAQIRAGLTVHACTETEPQWP